MESCVIAKIAECDKYLSLHPEFGKAFAFLKRGDLATIPAGRYEIDGERCWANVCDVELEPRVNRKVEAHRAYIDIQAPITASEEIGLCELTAEQLAMQFNEKDDCVLFAGETRPVVLHPGEFGLFFPPKCGHAPCCLPNGGQSKIRKVIIKVKVG